MFQSGCSLTSIKEAPLPPSTASRYHIPVRHWLRIIFFTLIVLVGTQIYVYAELILTGSLNINSATENELALLPQIGKIKAKAIRVFRGERGTFKDIEHLLAVRGIGKKTLESVRPYVKLSGKSDLTIVEEEEVNDRNTGRHESIESGITLLVNDAFFLNILESIKGARREIVGSMFIFKTSQYSANRANILLDALGDAAERGVNVFLLLERGKKETDSVTAENSFTAEKLSKRGVMVGYDAPERTTHTKVIVIDGKAVFLGSHNFTHSALKYNNELSVRVDSSTFAGDVLSYIKSLR